MIYPLEVVVFVGTKTVVEGKHQSSHGYTPHINSFNVNRVVSNDYIKDDNVGNPWPAGLETRPT
ncbi:hypothetical protein F4825DRAFT_424785 [Nemania diffusa]|nr:hypothetical protein F4825DRAFT_424785 [Nemania diffusa]